MSLEMKRACQTCGGGLAADDVAFICSHECTFCPGCATQTGRVCPNCAGELVPRPRRSVR
ncbi:MAG: DUF1272 domain-containing protein [Thermoplasmata archaeon]|nr:DUF1272 domain-containing protein [Thermoplasmata archaeon]